jgi:hypothetical protein
MLLAESGRSEFPITAHTDQLHDLFWSADRTQTDRMDE